MKTGWGFAFVLVAGCAVHATTETTSAQAGCPEGATFAADINACETVSEHAVRMTRQRQEKMQADRAAADAERVRRDRENEACRFSVESFERTCAGVAALDARAAQCTNPIMGPKYREAAASRRRDLAGSVLIDIARRTHDVPAVQDLASPDAVLANIEPAKVRLEELKCLDPAAGATAQQTIDTWAVAVAKAVADENTCRATPACVGARIAVDLCTEISRRKGNFEEIAKEKRNPGGVVNLTYLHQLGEAIQDNDAKIKELRALYKDRTHATFADASCKPR